MSLKWIFFIISTFYFLLAFLCLLYLPNFDSYITEEHPHTQRRHRHVLIRDWLLQKCANLSSPTDTIVRNYELGDKFYFVSAYYDTRKDLSHYIRLLVAIRNQGQRLRVGIAKNDINLHCHVPLEPNKYYTTPAVLYEMNENHARPIGSFIFSCPLPPQLQVSSNVCSVRITDGPDHTKDLDGNAVKFVDMPVLSVPRQQKYEFTVCLPALFGSISSRRLMDFVEMSRALGAQHFFFYKTKEIDTQPDVSNLLRHYESVGLATVFNWRAIQQFRQLIFYEGQELAIHHCLYWNMGLSKYTTFQDFDELLVPNPQKYKSWKEMTVDIDDGTHCGFRFFSAFFKPELGFFDAKRTEGVSRVRTKCMVRPDLIFEMGIHHISKQNIEEKTPKTKNTDIAILHHYSQCRTAFESSNARLCSNFVPDNSLHSWRDKFMKLKLETVHRINAS